MTRQDEDGRDGERAALRNAGRESVRDASAGSSGPLPEACLLLRASKRQWECTGARTAEEMLRVLRRERISRALVVDCRRRQPIAMLQRDELARKVPPRDARAGIETLLGHDAAAQPEHDWDALAGGDDRLHAVIVVDPGSTTP